MKAVVFHGVGDIRLDDVPEPRIQDDTDAIVRITSSAICGTDLHMVRGTLPGMVPGTILGHEGVGVVEEVGRGVRNLRPGDRVVIPSTIACGACEPCRSGLSSQCDRANPNGPSAGTAFFGGPKATGPFHGLQAEYARVPFANAGPVRIPGGVTDEQALTCSDIFPTGWYAADMADLAPGCTVLVLGCGPVGQMAIASCRLMGAGRVLAIDGVPSRLDAARAQGAEVVDFESEDPVDVVMQLTSGRGVDRVIDAVGVDAVHPHRGPAARQARRFEQRHRDELDEIAHHRAGGDWRPGDAPSLPLVWAVELVRKGGTVSIVGVYPETHRRFPLGKAMNRNLSLRMGNCPHRRYVPTLLDLVRSGRIDPARVLEKHRPMTDAIEAFRHFDRREPGWLKVELIPRTAAVT